MHGMHAMCIALFFIFGRWYVAQLVNNKKKEEREQRRKKECIEMEIEWGDENEITGNINIQDSRLSTTISNRKQ